MATISELIKTLQVKGRTMESGDIYVPCLCNDGEELWRYKIRRIKTNG